MDNQHTDRLIAWWGQADGKGLHPEDAAFLKDYPDPKLKLETRDDLCPIPYVGNLRTAKLVMVMLNPGYDDKDQEHDEKHERDSLISCLKQKPGTHFWPLTIQPRDDVDGPASRRYWRSIFRSFTTAQSEHQEETYQLIARNICCVQLIPYHSKTAPNVGACKRLPSVKQMITWIGRERALRQRPMIIFRGWPYLRELQDLRNDQWLIAFKPGASFLRKPSFNPQGKLSQLAAQALLSALR